ncbi:galactitol-1-phosphate 5-dehydrogenase [Dolosicoccus paucivorans]
MKALSVVDTQTFELVDIDKPEPKEDEVRISVAYTGICGSDMARYFKGQVHSFPQILGHEFSGIVDEVGSKVTRLKVGDRVAVAPLKPCGTCQECQQGNPAMCTNYSFLGSREPGSLAEYVVAPEVNCLIVPNDLSLKEAALIEPLTVAIHGVDRLRVEAGDHALVLGCGTIGLLTIAVLKARGVEQIIATDLKDANLKLAKKFGADVVVNTGEKNLDDFFNHESLPNLVYETAGSKYTHVDAIKYTAKKAQVCYIGTSTEAITFDYKVFEQINRRELMVTGSWMSYSSPFPGKEWTAALKYMSTGQIKVKDLITGVYHLEEKSEPFDRLANKDIFSVKELYEINKE